MLPNNKMRIEAENFLLITIVFDANLNEIECIRRLLTLKKKTLTKAFKNFNQIVN